MKKQPNPTPPTHRFADARSTIVPNAFVCTLCLAVSACGSPSSSTNASSFTAAVDANAPPADDAGTNPVSVTFDGAAGSTLWATRECEGGSCAADAMSAAVACPDGGSTSISGTVYDPAAQNSLYNVSVYVPASPLPSFPAGATCSSCGSLFPAAVSASAVTDTAGHFTMQNVPAGTSTLVVQIGKWRRVYSGLQITECADNSLPDRTVRLPRNSTEGDLPDIAVSTGGADSLECLPLRIGVDPAEYIGGSGPAGHIHIFTGAAGATTAPPSPPSPASYQALWDSTADLMANDVVLLSCEGRETANLTAQNQQSLFDYAAAGGRVFASHFHYVWLDTGPFGAANLAQWQTGAETIDDNFSFPAAFVTLLPNGRPFPEGIALQAWLGGIGALTGGELPVWFARDNVIATNPVSQAWLALDPSTPAPGATQYFSVDTPIGTTPPCGRVVYSDLHVSGGPGTAEPGVLPDYPGMNATGGIVPTGCALRPLTPQEEALEFMLFDLSSCLVPVGQPPPPPPVAMPR